MLNSENRFPHFPKLLIIAGTQQNVGKTTLASKIISHFTWEHKITAIKITHHFHKEIGTAIPLEKSKGYQILRENSPDTKKDTSIMLRAGAENAYLVQSTRESLIKAFTQLLKYIPEDNLIICESGILHEILCPGVFLVLRQLSCKAEEKKDLVLFEQADRVVTYTLNGFDFSISDILVTPNGWRLEKHALKKD